MKVLSISHLQNTQLILILIVVLLDITQDNNDLKLSSV